MSDRRDRGNGTGQHRIPVEAFRRAIDEDHAEALGEAARRGTDPALPHPHTHSPRVKIGIGHVIGGVGGILAAAGAVVAFSVNYFGTAHDLDLVRADVTQIQTHDAEHDQGDASDHEKVDNLSKEFDDFVKQYQVDRAADHDLLIRIAGQRGVRSDPP